MSATEAERGTRRSEHLLYLQRRQRALLAAFGAEHGRLARLAKVLREVDSGGGALPSQVRVIRAATYSSISCDQGPSAGVGRSRSHVDCLPSS